MGREDQGPSAGQVADRAAGAGKGWRLLSEREEEILDMWPRFEDGEYVWFDDEFADPFCSTERLEGLTLHSDGQCTLHAESLSYEWRLDGGAPIRRPAPEEPMNLTHARVVVDAGGAPIHEGDTVWIIPECTDTPDEPHEVRSINRWGEVLLEFHTEGSTGVKGEYLTHTRPDSWERLEEAAREFARDNQLPHDVDQMERDAVDLIRRAKALAGAADE